MFHKAVRSRIEEVGVVPVLRLSSIEDAGFAAESILQGGVPIVEIAVSVPGAVRVISSLGKQLPDIIVGAGSVLDARTAHQCLDAGAKFLTTDGLIFEVVEYAKSQDAVVFPGALTPSEVIAAWRAGSDFVKVVPCAAVGGENYIRALKAQMPEIPLIAAGGVNQQTAGGFISAGAVAIGVGEGLTPWEAIALRQSRRISELARRFLNFVETARNEMVSRSEGLPVPVHAENLKHADEFQPLQSP